MNIVSILLNVIVGAVFILSAWLKYTTLDYFEAKISTFGFEGVWASVLARLILSFEFLLGFLLVAQLTVNKWIQRITLITIAGFIVINLIDFIKYGNDTNCGCMGHEVSISPLMSIAKNILLGIFTFVAMRFGKTELRLPDFARWMIFVLPFSIMFFLKPVYIPVDPKMPMKGKKLNFAAMNGHPGVKGKTYTDDLSKGKKIVAFLSWGCPHCKLAAYKLNNIKAADRNLPIFFIMNGDSAKLPAFQKAMGKPLVEMAHFNQGNTDDFSNMSGLQLPSIYLVKNGVVEVQLSNGTISRSLISDWYYKK